MEYGSLAASHRTCKHPRSRVTVTVVGLLQVCMCCYIIPVTPQCLLHISSNIKVCATHFQQTEVLQCLVMIVLVSLKFTQVMKSVLLAIYVQLLTLGITIPLLSQQSHLRG